MDGEKEWRSKLVFILFTVAYLLLHDIKNPDL
jgi:hypothetical protein